MDTKENYSKEVKKRKRQFESHDDNEVKSFKKKLVSSLLQNASGNNYYKEIKESRQNNKSKECNFQRNAKTVRLQIKTQKINRTYNQLQPDSKQKIIAKNKNCDVPSRNSSTKGGRHKKSCSKQVQPCNLTSATKAIIQCKHDIASDIEPQSITKFYSVVLKNKFTDSDLSYSSHINSKDSIELKNYDVTTSNQIVSSVNFFKATSLSHFEEQLKTSHHFLVIDTNILLESKDILVLAKGKPFRNKIVTFFIPFIVLQELDNLKNRKMLKNKVQSTIKWLNSLLTIKDPFIIGQDLESHLLASSKYNYEIADDFILNCCQYLQKIGKSAQLLSNDVNLQNKALLSGIETFDSIFLENYFTNSEIKITVPNHEKSKKSDSNSSVITSHAENSSDSSNSVSSEPHSNKSSLKPNEVSTIKITLPMIQEYIINCLGNLLKYMMIDCFGEKLWKEIVLYKPPWNAIQVLKCFHKHWIAVFMEKFSNDMHSMIKSLIEDLKTNSKNVKLSVVATKLKLLRCLVKNEPYRNFLAPFPPVCSSLQPTPMESTKKSKECQSSPMNTEHSVLGKEFDLLPLSNIRNAIVEVGLHAMELKELLVHSPEPTNVSSLDSLRNFLVSFGFTIKSALENPQKSSSIMDQICYFWINASAEGPKKTFHWTHEMELKFAENEGTFLQLCLNDLEQLIQSIDLALNKH